jgi:hypothetical protein
VVGDIRLDPTEDLGQPYALLGWHVHPPAADGIGHLPVGRVVVI